MPIEKDFKRLVRRRMQKTGESYTAARTQLVRARRDGAPTHDTTPAAVAAPPPSTKPRRETIDYAALAGMSDAAIEKATGCRWEKWVKSLDWVEAHTWPHREIAAHVHDKYAVSGWWSQAVTVGYERIRGLRAIGQRRGGGFEASKSRTFAVAAITLFAAFADARRRARWLPGVKLTVRTATPPRSIRMSWPDGTAVQAWFTAKGAGKCAVAIQHTKLADRDAVERAKAFWSERLEALSSVVERK